MPHTLMKFMAMKLNNKHRWKDKREKWDEVCEGTFNENKETFFCFVTNLWWQCWASYDDDDVEIYLLPYADALVVIVVVDVVNVVVDDDVDVDVDVDAVALAVPVAVAVR